MNPTFPPFVRRFWSWVLSLAAVVGLYLGALQVQLVIAFWIVLGVAVLGAGVKPTVNFIVDAGSRYRTQPRLLERVAELELAASEARDASSNQEETEAAEYRRGLIEGLDRAKALVVGTEIQPPELRAIKLDDHGRLLLVAQYASDSAPPSEWSRYNVEVVATGDVHGAVRYVKADTGRCVVYLAPVRSEPDSEPFWSGLARRAAEDHAPPVGVALTSYTLPDDVHDESAPQAHLAEPEAEAE